MSKKILVIDANPSKFSLTACLAEEYSLSAKGNGFDVKTLNLRELEFDPILHFGYSRRQTLEPDLEKSQEMLSWCEHLVLFSPVWWYSFPALLKGFFDRVFLPEFAFEIKTGPKRQIIKMMSGKTATVFCTYGGPKNNMGTDFEDPFGFQIKHGILYFCGFENVEVYPFYETVGFRNIKRRQNLIDDLIKFGAEGK
ncbi:MAG: NAD(P)H-dependent oxidoreductase [Rickettsiales bacterium]|jgi:putative NADPH-quinone reductase|nr:NAD(P)H-dependent oxidoreductase [Rickettsiales bacterium]